MATMRRWNKISAIVNYEELTPTEFRARLADAPIAYLPLGTLEWHGENLPLGSDGIQSRGFFVELAHQVGGIVVPMLFLGPDSSISLTGDEFYGMDLISFRDEKPEQLPGSAYWVSDDLFEHILSATLKQLSRAGFRIVVAHGHGPSTTIFQKHIVYWEQLYGLELFVCWRQDESDGLGIMTDHAAANETSLVMALRPDLVHMENISSATDDWPLGIMGDDPRIHASAENGRIAIDMQSERMRELLTEALERTRG